MAARGTTAIARRRPRLEQAVLKERIMNEVSGLGLVLDQVAKDKNIDREVLVEALEQAILTAAKRTFGMHREMEAKFNEDTGRGRPVPDRQGRAAGRRVPGNEITLEDAHKFGLEAERRRRAAVPDLLPRRRTRPRREEQDEQVRRRPRAQDRACKSFGRIAAQTAKQVILPARARGRARERLQRVQGPQGRAHHRHRAPLRARQHHRRPRRRRGGAAGARAGAARVVPRRRPHRGLRASTSTASARGPQIILSRAHKGLLEKLFEMEVPEIYEKIVRIEASAREPGARAKIAVSARATATSIRSAPAWA